jgi:hypothetical protein
VFIDSPHLKHGKEIFAGEFFLHVMQYKLICAALKRFVLQPCQIFISLTDICTETDHLTAIVFLQPRHDHGGVQPS